MDIALVSAPELLAAAEARRDAYLRLPESLWESRVVFVDDEAGLRLARERLRGVDVVGIDTEWAAPLNEGGGGGGARTLSGAGEGRKKRESGGVQEVQEERGGEQEQEGNYVASEACL